MCRSVKECTAQAYFETSWVPLFSELTRVSSDGVPLKSWTERILLNGISASESPASTSPRKPAGTSETLCPARVMMQSSPSHVGIPRKTSRRTSCRSASAFLSGTEP